MANRDAWNNEVRVVGEGDTQEGTIADTDESAYWSIEKGGCEGMHKITADGTSNTDIVGISRTDAEGRLAEYERYKRRFPTSEMRPIT